MFYTMKNNIYENLYRLGESDYYPFHMPGHKRRADLSPLPNKLDITEIDGFDELYHATGILQESMQRAARIYQSRRTFLGVNGSTGCLLAAIFAAFRPGDRVIVARNCHKAVYHAIELRGLIPIYLYPAADREWGACKGVSAAEVRKLWMKQESSHIAGMILTSPTYEGNVSEVAEIAEFIHSRNGVLVVDEAHGAHFGFYPDFPRSSVTLGADLVVQSMHKTLPALTQTALLHVATDRVEEELVQKYWGMYHTSSPSYLLMASMDLVFKELDEKGKEAFAEYAELLSGFYKEAKHFKNIRLWQQEGRDPGKIVISLGSGDVLYSLLRERYHLQPEMCSPGYCLLMTSVADTKEGFARLLAALKELDAEFDVAKDDAFENLRKETKIADFYEIRPERVCTAAEAVLKDKRHCDIRDCVGETAAEYVYLYPPGIPFLVPGERISKEMKEQLLLLKEKGFSLKGMADLTGNEIYVIKDKGN